MQVKITRKNRGFGLFPEGKFRDKLLIIRELTSSGGVSAPKIGDDRMESLYQSDAIPEKISLMEKKRIILADDHGILRAGLAAMLEKSEELQIVGEARDGEELLNLISELKPDLAIVDISMPRMDGMDAISRIRQRHPEIKLLVLTMHKNRKTMQDALKRGANGYLLKDDVSENLLHGIRTLLQGKQFISQELLYAIAGDFLDDDLAEKKNNLTQREKEILGMVAKGYTSLQISRELDISPRTVEGHRANLRIKLDATDLSALVDYAKKFGLADE